MRKGKNKLFKASYKNFNVNAVKPCYEKIAFDTIDALKNINREIKFQPIKKKYKKIFDIADKIAKNCPIKMGGPGNLDLLYWISEYLKAQKIIETGVAYGWSSLAILLSIKKRENSTLISTDRPYINLNNDKYVGCVVPENLKSNWCIIKKADRDALPKAIKNLDTIDMCHYDSDKSYEGRTWAYNILWEAIRAGGCFISDDIDDNYAFYDFCKKIKKNPIIVRTPDENRLKYVGILMKDK